MAMTLAEFENTFPIRIELPVQWGEMDAFKHVNNATYFRYFESARLAYFEACGLFGRTESSTIGPILASTECQYRRPVNYPDQLWVGARIGELQRFGFIQHYGIFSQTQQALTTEGSGRIVLLDYNSNTKVEPDAQLLARIGELEWQ
jgi:acyl-CoA thioester hydrolase